MPNFSTLDWLVIAVYFLTLFGIAIWVMRQKTESSADYFLAGRHVGWFVIGASIFASNVGSEHIVGLAGSGATTGLVMGHYELHSYLCLLLGWVFVPFYMRSAVFTMPEFLERRYSQASRWLLSITTLVAYVLTKISVTIYAGAVVFEVLMGIDFWTGALLTVLLTGAYTIVGGLRAVVYTEALQAIVLIIGSTIVTLVGLSEIGGWDGLVTAVGEEKFNMFLPLDDPQFPWLGIVLAAPIVGMWYWCTDQYIVQRVLAATDERTARRGTIFAAYLKMLPFFIFLIPGLIALGLKNSGKLDFARSDEAFPQMVATLLPTGVRGLVAGGLLAALMSSLAAVFNSASTLFTIDVYKKLRPLATERHLVRVGRIATGVLVVAGVLWIPILQGLSGQLYTYLQSVQAYIAPPIAAVFFLGLFFRRLNAQGAFAALVFGFVLGMGRLVLEVNKAHVPEWLLGFVQINFTYFAVLLFVSCCIVLVLRSLATSPPDAAQIEGLTYATTVAKDRRASRASWTALDVVLSVIILVAIACILAFFSPLVF